MMTNFQNVDEYGRREFIAHAAKACSQAGLMPMAGSYIHDSVKHSLLELVLLQPVMLSI